MEVASDRTEEPPEAEALCLGLLQLQVASQRAGDPRPHGARLVHRRLSVTLRQGEVAKWVVGKYRKCLG